MGMLLMVCALVIGIPMMAIAWRRSPAAGFWIGVMALAVHAIGHLLEVS